MAYKVTFTKAAKRQFDKLSPAAQRQLGKAVDALAIEPRPAGVVKLSGEDHLYRIRSGDYRAIYQIQDQRLLILVVKVGHRSQVYRRH
ncbi:type II toxin-antitoxin system RelE family toxin [Halochromatium glycolicum]|uniref:Type II toxin-antitoxin system mRNA interferase toxin, RelE/StbE family n=1 Tax=Halochromatium glycolicum TaxID=85075 RepID=A0AAJ0U2U7_9GAMM|nr:type II toxin-antitoxin system RelE/ParE family toxin [Halochromatium glycolicum]MBK1704265.1 type II toxin-antitoxin system mRNA interferase toxin, RelE/StbE family [Halochromatium glycolicum]